MDESKLCTAAEIDIEVLCDSHVLLTVGYKLNAEPLTMTFTYDEWVAMADNHEEVSDFFKNDPSAKTVINPGAVEDALVFQEGFATIYTWKLIADADDVTIMKQGSHLTFTGYRECYMDAVGQRVKLCEHKEALTKIAIERVPFKIPTRGKLIKSCILFLIRYALSCTRCPGCATDHPSQEKHTVLPDGCLAPLDRKIMYYAEDIRLTPSLLNAVASRVSKRLHMVPDPTMFLAACFAIELNDVTDFKHQLCYAENVIDRLCAEICP
jgi:hypothetical protein